MDYYKYLFSNAPTLFDDEELDPDLIEELERLLEETFSKHENANKDADFVFELDEEEKAPKKPENNCEHRDITTNHAGNIVFWQCKTCKEDLGDVNE